MQSPAYGQHDPNAGGLPGCIYGKPISNEICSWNSAIPDRPGACRGYQWDHLGRSVNYRTAP
jgi:hypothetical protein